MASTKREYSEVVLSLDNVLIPEEQRSTTPSMQDGLEASLEKELRFLGCELIQSGGILLKLPQVAMATGQVLFQRFYYSKSFVKHDMEIVAMACLALASKIEESPRRIRETINVFNHLRQLRCAKKITPLLLDSNYVTKKNQVIKAERRLLKELGFCVHVKHPHKLIVTYLNLLKVNPASSDLFQRAWNLMNDSFRTNVFVRAHPERIAIACIFLAARQLGVPLCEDPPWYEVFGSSASEVLDISQEIMQLYTVNQRPDWEQLERRVEEIKNRLIAQRRHLREPQGGPGSSEHQGFGTPSQPMNAPNTAPSVSTNNSPNPSSLAASAVTAPVVNSNEGGTAPAAAGPAEGTSTTRSRSKERASSRDRSSKHGSAAERRRDRSSSRDRDRDRRRRPDDGSPARGREHGRDRERSRHEHSRDRDRSSFKRSRSDIGDSRDRKESRERNRDRPGENHSSKRGGDDSRSSKRARHDLARARSRERDRTRDKDKRADRQRDRDRDRDRQFRYVAPSSRPGKTAAAHGKSKATKVLDLYGDSSGSERADDQKSPGADGPTAADHKSDEMDQTHPRSSETSPTAMKGGQRQKTAAKDGSQRNGVHSSTTESSSVEPTKPVVTEMTVDR